MQIVKVIYCFRILNSQQLLNSIPGISYSFKLSIDTNIRRKGQSSCNLSTFNFELRCLLRLVKAKKKNSLRFVIKVSSKSISKRYVRGFQDQVSRNLFPRSSSLLYLALVYTKTVDSVKGGKLLIALKARSD